MVKKTILDVPTATPTATDVIYGVKNPSGTPTDYKATIASVADYAAQSGTFTQAGSGAVSRTLQSKLRDTVSVKDFGAVGDGVTDDTLAFQRAFNYVNSVGGGVVFIPPGRYRKADTAGSTWIMYSNTTLKGVGDSSVIFWDDKNTVARSGNDMLSCSNATNVAFQDFKIEGTALTYLNETNQKQCLTGAVIDGIRLEGLTIEAVRFMATAFSRCKNVICQGNRLVRVVRDGLRFTHSSNVSIVNNVFRDVSDDCIALHSLDNVSEVVPSGATITGNVIEACQGIKVLGAKALVISNNVFRRCIRSPVDIEISASSPTEGNTTQLCIDVSGNQFLDTFTGFGTNYVIRIRSDARATGGLSTQPGVNATHYAYNYLNNTDTGTPVKPGMWAVRVSNNHIARTLPTASKYSDYGYGQIFDRVSSGFVVDPAITSSNFQLHGIEIGGPVDGLQIQGNRISGTGTGLTAIRFFTDGSSNLIDFNNVLIQGNIIQDCPGVGVGFSDVGSSAKNIFIQGNVFDLDPFFRAASHNADNTWTTAGSVLAIQAGTTILAAFVTGNVFKHMGQPSDAAGSNSWNNDNFVFCDPAGDGDNASNKGVRSLSLFRGSIFVVYDADPTSATFGQITTIPLSDSSTMPTTGKYVRGHVVNAPQSSLISGWRRLTTGTGHVLNTDWVEIGTAKGAASSTDNAVARFDLTTGRVLQNSGVIIDDSNNITGVAALTASGVASGQVLRATGDVGGAASSIQISNVSDTTANSSGVGAIKFKGATSRDSVGFVKIYIGTTAYYVPVFDAITG